MNFHMMRTNRRENGSWSLIISTFSVSLLTKTLPARTHTHAIRQNLRKFPFPTFISLTDRHNFFNGIKLRENKKAKQRMNERIGKNGQQRISGQRK